MLMFEGCKNLFCKKTKGRKFVGGRENSDLCKETDARKIELQNLGYKTDDFGGWRQSCEFLESIKKDVEFMKKFKPFPKFIKPRRLQSQSACYGGFLDVIKYLWSKEKSPHQNFLCFDINR